ncbi:hypothetical protein BDM02DRAFT_3117405 [Thelephora ganbajun]|uniref:Uncharacterized protein n=1 Tax=Thelephora ganbajun TaxID=370292 RepID=A0ACB6ZCK8_THEGA|nr:hypothetical protein BDM02DRAFT_3117405 [Thelephora ganbajun]
MDAKVRLKQMREIPARLVDRTKGVVNVMTFGDRMILDEGEPRLFAPHPKSS